MKTIARALVLAIALAGCGGASPAATQPPATAGITPTSTPMAPTSTSATATAIVSPTIGDARTAYLSCVAPVDSLLRSVDPGRMSSSQHSTFSAELTALEDCINSISWTVPATVTDAESLATEIAGLQGVEAEFPSPSFGDLLQSLEGMSLTTATTSAAKLRKDLGLPADAGF